MPPTCGSGDGLPPARDAAAEPNAEPRPTQGAGGGRERGIGLYGGDRQEQSPHAGPVMGRRWQAEDAMPARRRRLYRPQRLDGFAFGLVDGAHALGQQAEVRRDRCATVKLFA